MKMIKDYNGKFGVYSISPKTRQILMHWGYELLAYIHIKISYYWFNKQELLRKARGRYHNGGKKKAAKYYIREVLSGKAGSRYRSLPEKEKEAKTEYQRERYHMNTALNEKLTIPKRLLWLNEEKKMKC